MTFQEARLHLGIETERQWTRRAIERTAVLLVGDRHEVLGGGVVARGWAQAAQLTIRRMIQFTQQHGAIGVLARNCLARDTLPYPSEQRVARMLEHAASLAGLRMIDYLVVGTDGRYYSEVEEAADPGR